MMSVFTSSHIMITLGEKGAAKVAKVATTDEKKDDTSEKKTNKTVAKKAVTKAKK